MNKYSCTNSSGEDIFYVTLVAEDERQAKEMAVAETRQGRPRNWSVRLLEAGVEGPARSLSSGNREA